MKDEQVKWSLGVVALVVVLLVAVSALGGDKTGGPDGLHTAWVNAVDHQESTGDCAALQEMFDNADANERDSSVKVAKLEYVDNALRTVGCYD